MEKVFMIDVIFNPNNPSGRHSRAGGNPARKKATRNGQNRDVGPHSREIIINWIPAFAGMSRVCANKLFGV